jgi:hypothetical protein
MSDEKETIERAFSLCINERMSGWLSEPGKARYNVVRIEAHGIVRFACWWFVIWSIVDLIATFVFPSVPR